MLHHRFIRIVIGLALLLAALAPQPAQAARPKLAAIDPDLSMLKDINPGTNSSIYYTADSAIPFGDKVFFLADDGVHGLEPWISDGTPAGTTMIKDINPNGDGIYCYRYYTPVVPVTWNGKVFFAAYGAGPNNALVPQLWISDGTAAGTRAVTNASHPIASFRVGTQGVTFIEDSAENQEQVWWTDGTAAKTVQAYVWNDTNNGSVYEAMEYKGAVYITAGYTLIKVDLATRLATVLDAVNQWWIFGVTNNLLILDKYNIAASQEGIWQTDGTPQGLKEITDTLPDIYYTNSFLVTANALYFSAVLVDTPGINHLYKTQGKASGITEIFQFPRTPSDIIPRDMTEINGSLFFMPATYEDGVVATPWRSDGTPAGTWSMCPTCLHSRVTQERPWLMLRTSDCER